MNLFKKRGLSPVVATVLLIALILVLAAIIFLWTRGFVKESVEKNGLKAEEACNLVRFDAYYDPLQSKLSIVNEGNVAIRGFEIKQVTGGDSERVPFYLPVNAGGTIPPIGVELGKDLDSIQFFPIILTVKNATATATKMYTCLDHSKKITIKK